MRILAIITVVSFIINVVTVPVFIAAVWETRNSNALKPQMPDKTKMIIIIVVLVIIFLYSMYRININPHDELWEKYFKHWMFGEYAD